ncbi:MAG: hypothetical protein ACI3VB_00480 [Oscillospiraceae bacterium]
MTILETSRLRVKVCGPGEFPNTTRRFDRAIFIPSVVLDGDHEFCVVEPTDLPQPTSGGVGMCNEIKDDLWDSTPAGGKVPKFGIGVLTKPDDKPYEIYIPYEVDPFPISVLREGNTMTFDTAPKPCQGYALHERKVLTVEGNTISIEYLFENVGEKALSLSEYCHNFFNIDAHPTGPKHMLSIPACVPLDGRRAPTAGTHFIGKGRGMSFDGPNTVSSIITVGGEDIDRSVPFSWTLSHSDSPATVTEEVSFAPSSVPVWAFDNVISPEVYNQFTLEPGKVITYSRKWTFND